METSYFAKWGVSRNGMHVRMLHPGMPYKRGEIIVAAPLSASSVDVRAIYFKQCKRKGS